MSMPDINSPSSRWMVRIAAIILVIAGVLVAFLAGISPDDVTAQWPAFLLYCGMALAIGGAAYNATPHGMRHTLFCTFVMVVSGGLEIAGTLTQVLTKGVGM